MTLTECFYKNQMILMEGALGERLKREYGLQPDPEIALASLIFEDKGKVALREIWSQYLSIAEKYKLPFMATTPTRRANYDRVKRSGYHKNIIAKHVADESNQRKYGYRDVCRGSDGMQRRCLYGRGCTSN